MNFKQLAIFIYGLFMGTTVSYLKTHRKSVGPTVVHKLDEGAFVFLGGAGNCLALRNSQAPSEVLLVDTNMLGAALGLKNSFQREWPAAEVVRIINTHFHRENCEGNELYNSAQILVGEVEDSQLQAEWSKSKEELIELNLTKIKEKTEIKFGDEFVEIIPFANAHTFCDLVVVLKKRRLIVWGDLFFNQVHPAFRQEHGMNVQNWISAIETVLKEYSDYQMLPGEGNLATGNEVELFVQYLRDLQDVSKEFSYMREHYDWKEIEGYTSLEENFDMLRKVGAGTAVVRS